MPECAATAVIATAVSGRVKLLVAQCRHDAGRHPKPFHSFAGHPGRQATITLNRPAHRNRPRDADLETLLAHFAQVDADASVRVLVLRANTEGQPRPVFCAGYDMSGFEQDAQASSAFERVPDVSRRCARSRSARSTAASTVARPTCSWPATSGSRCRGWSSACRPPRWDCISIPVDWLRYVERSGLAAAKAPS